MEVLSGFSKHYGGYQHQSTLDRGPWACSYLRALRLSATSMIANTCPLETRLEL